MVHVKSAGLDSGKNKWIYNSLVNPDKQCVWQCPLFLKGCVGLRVIYSNDTFHSLGLHPAYGGNLKTNKEGGEEKGDRVGGEEDQNIVFVKKNLDLVQQYSLHSLSI